MKLRPIHAILLVVLFGGIVMAADFVLGGGLGRARYERIAPDRNGNVMVGVGDLAPNEVRFYRFLNPSNQEVLFFVGRDKTGEIHVAFDAAESDYKLKRGFSFHDGWMVNNKCETACRLTEVNEGRGGCRPVPIEHRVAADTVVIPEQAMLKGWRYFR